MLSGSFCPGDLAMWHSGSAEMTWPPDGIRIPKTPIYSLSSKTNIFVMIVSSFQNHGKIVLAHNGLWWCPISSLIGELSGSRM
jgi:hypothetical protein